MRKSWGSVGGAWWKQPFMFSRALVVLPRFAKGKLVFGLLVEFQTVGVAVPRSRVFAMHGSVKRVETKHEYDMKSIVSGQNLGFPSDFYHFKQLGFQYQCRRDLL